MNTLADLPIGRTAIVYGFQDLKPTISSESRLCRFVELGLETGAETVRYRSPFGGYPMAVEIKNQLIGLGFEESSQILVTLNPKE